MRATTTIIATLLVGLTSPAVALPQVQEANEQDLALASTARQFFEAWLVDRDPETALSFTSEDFFWPACSSDDYTSPERPDRGNVLEQTKEAFTKFLDYTPTSRNLADLIVSPEPGFADEELVSHPTRELFEVIKLPDGEALIGMACRGWDPRPFVQEALSRNGLYIMQVAAKLKPAVLEEMRKLFEKPEHALEFLFVWRQEEAQWRILTIDDVREYDSGPRGRQEELNRRNAPPGSGKTPLRRIYARP